MKLTKSKLKQLVQEEIRMAMTEAETLDLSQLEPTVEKAAAGVLNTIKGISKEEQIQRMVLTALIAKLTEMTK